MSNAARKARKRAGIKFERQPKQGTPYQDRVARMVQDERTLEVHPSKRQRRKNMEYHRLTHPEPVGDTSYIKA